VDETDDSTLWKGSDEEENVRNKCKEDENIDCEEGQ
jgi:hypothetical protein